MKNRIRLTESQLNKVIRESVRKVLSTLKESQEQPQPINDNSENYYNNKYRIFLWPGSGYMTVPFDVFANHEEEALEIVVAYIEQNPSYHFLLADDAEQKYVDEEFNGDREEAGNDPVYEETFWYIDGTMEGAKQPHYLWGENIRIKRL